MTSETDRAAALDDLCRLSFDAFAQRAFRILVPGMPYEFNWHIECLSYYLEAMYAGEIPRLIVNLPPRSLKSYLVSKAFPAWVLGRDPTQKFINTSYGYEIAEANARGCKAIMKDDWYQAIFPRTRIGGLDRTTHFETTEKGQYYAATALSPITGLGCGWLQIDDPLKPMEATSETIRNSTNENIRTTLFSRFDDFRKAKVLVVMQRTHENDPTGNLVRDGGYIHLKLPGEAKQRMAITWGEKTKVMEPGDLLFEKRFPREVLDQMLLDMGAYNYAGQILQEPVPVGGGEFRPQWVQYYPYGGIKPREMNIAILVDAAAGEESNKKKKKTSDWTAMMVVGLAPDNNYYLLDIVRDRLNPTERIDMLFILHRKWNDLGGKPPRVGYEKYGMMADTFYVQEKQKQDAYRFHLTELGGQMVKEDRIRRLIPDMQLGRWYFPQNLHYVDSEGRAFDLVHELVNSEFASFPKARFDDMCFVADTMIATDKGEVPIQHMKIGDRVLTPDGYRAVYDCGFTGVRQVTSYKNLVGTGNHPVFTVDNGYIRMDALSGVNESLELNLCGWISIALLKGLSSTASSIRGWGEVVSIIYHNEKTIKNGQVVRAFMWQFGSFIRDGQLQKATKFITRTMILLTTALIIWSAYRKACIARCLRTWIEKRCLRIWTIFVTLPSHGTSPKRAGNGTGNTPIGLSVRYLSNANTPASNAAKPSQRESPEWCGSAPICVGNDGAARSNHEPIGTRLSVLRAAKKLWVKNRQVAFVQEPASIHETRRRRVYNLSVEGAHCYFANGLLVHNCDALSRVYDMDLTFPRPKNTLKQNILAAAVPQQQESWRDF